MVIDLDQPIYPQVRDLTPSEYKQVTETIRVKEKDVYDYKKIRLYDSAVLNYFTKSSLGLCYAFWCLALCYCFCTVWEIPALSVANIMFFVAGIFKWFNFAHFFHKKIHGPPEQFIGFWRWWHFNGHGYHHICPYDPSHIVIHPWIASVAIIPTYVLATALHYVGVVSGDFVSLFVSGLVIGHMYIETSHYSMHYPTFLTAYVKRLKYHHMSHHLKTPQRKFAYFHPLEDKLKGTN